MAEPPADGFAESAADSFASTDSDISSDHFSWANTSTNSAGSASGVSRLPDSVQPLRGGGLGGSVVMLNGCMEAAHGGTYWYSGNTAGGPRANDALTHTPTAAPHLIVWSVRRRRCGYPARELSTRCGPAAWRHLSGVLRFVGR